MAEKQLILPRTDDNGNSYISYSQINLWKRSKRDYIRQYFFGEKSADALKPYGDFGHKVGKALENNDFSEFNAKETKLLKTVPRFDEFERKVNLKLKGTILIGYIDTNTIPKDYDNKQGVHIRRIADYKTGDISTKQEKYKSDKYIQLEIYAAAIQQEFGVLPYSACIYLIDRIGNAFKREELKLGNKFVTITKKINQKRIDKVLKEVQDIAEEISQHYKLFLTLNEVINE